MRERSTRTRGTGGRSVTGEPIRSIPPRPKRRYISGKDREEVRVKLTKAMADRDGGMIFDAGKLTIGEYLDRWLRDSVKGTVKETTYANYA